MKYEMMLKILFELLSKKSVQASYLAEKYEISVRSVYRYINSLDYAGIPIYTKRGNNGGFYIMENYKLPASFLTREEFSEAIAALKGLNEQVNNKTITSVINKLLSLTKKDYYDVNIKSGNLIIDATPWGDVKDYKNHLTFIEKSIEDGYLLSIDYQDRFGEVSKRIIEPHSVVLKQGLWYVFAYCRLRKAFRLFKIGRITQITIMKEKFEKRPLPEVLPFENWYDSQNLTEIEFEVSDKAVSDVEEWIGINNVKRGKDKITAKALLPMDDILIGKILGFGNEIKVVAPKKLQKMLKDKVNKIVKYYN